MQEHIARTRQWVHHIITRKLDFSPWVFFSDAQIQTASGDLYRKYPARKILCFARNGDDHACLVLDGELAGKYIILHDFASVGWEFRPGAEVSSFGEILHIMLQDSMEMGEDWIPAA